jgi:hypothetical protein
MQLASGKTFPVSAILFRSLFTERSYGLGGTGRVPRRVAGFEFSSGRIDASTISDLQVHCLLLEEALEAAAIFSSRS